MRRHTSQPSTWRAVSPRVRCQPPKSPSAPGIAVCAVSCSCGRVTLSRPRGRRQPRRATPSSCRVGQPQRAPSAAGIAVGPAGGSPLAPEVALSPRGRRTSRTQTRCPRRAPARTAARSAAAVGNMPGGDDETDCRGRGWHARGVTRGGLGAAMPSARCRAPVGRTVRNSLCSTASGPPPPNCVGVSWPVSSTVPT